MSTIGEMVAQVCNNWNRLMQCYSTTPKKPETQRDDWSSELCLLLKSALFL